MRISFTNPRSKVMQVIPHAGNPSSVTCDYYLLAHLKGGDDDTCSKSQWLRDQLSDAGAEQVNGDAAHLPDQNRKGVLEWATSLFSEKHDYYVVIVERRSTNKIPMATFDMIYASPSLCGGLRKPIETDLEEFLQALHQQIGRFESDCARQTLLDKRRRESGQDLR